MHHTKLRPVCMWVHGVRHFEDERLSTITAITNAKINKASQTCCSFIFQTFAGCDFKTSVLVREDRFSPSCTPAFEAEAAETSSAAVGPKSLFEVLIGFYDMGFYCFRFLWSSLGILGILLPIFFHLVSLRVWLTCPYSRQGSSPPFFNNGQESATEALALRVPGPENSHADFEDGIAMAFLPVGISKSTAFATERFMSNTVLFT